LDLRTPPRAERKPARPSASTMLVQLCAIVVVVALLLFVADLYSVQAGNH
jgi:hypothetical protein